MNGRYDDRDQWEKMSTASRVATLVIAFFAIVLPMLLVAANALGIKLPTF